MSITLRVRNGNGKGNFELYRKGTSITKADNTVCRSTKACDSRWKCQVKLLCNKVAALSTSIKEAEFERYRRSKIRWDDDTRTNEWLAQLC